MLCPEVWKLTPRKHNSSYQIGKYDAKGKKSLDKTIRSNFFNQMVSIILPGLNSIPDSLQELFNSADYYLIRNLNLCDLVQKDFVEAFIKRGKLTGISIEAGLPNEYENKFLVTPNGILSIIICKDLYQILGLEGRPVGQSKERFEITIDLKNNNFLEQPKLYNRIKTALSSPGLERFDFQLTWESIDSNICPSSIAKFFNDSGYKVEQHSIQIQSTKTNNLQIPNEIVSCSHFDSDIAHKVAEYFAFTMLECDMNAGEELNSYRPSFNLDLDDNSSDCVILYCKGLMSSDFVANLLEQLRLSVDFKFVILAVNGNECSQVRGNKGDTFVVLNDKKYFSLTT